MKKIIDDAGEMHTYAELTPFKNPQHDGWMHLKVTTVFDAARNPDEEQVRFEMCLSPESFEKFKELFNAM
jgi:hypothetical protein